MLLNVVLKFTIIYKFVDKKMKSFNRIKCKNAILLSFLNCDVFKYALTKNYVTLDPVADIKHYCHADLWARSAAWIARQPPKL